MIAKDFDPLHSPSSSELSRRVAGEQMAAHLQRQFQDDPDVWVFNGLRFEHRGEVTQLDHLLLTRWGFFVIDSHSLVGSVRVDGRDNWQCTSDGVTSSVVSPVEQVAYQLGQLRRLLDDHADELLGRLVGLQKRFKGFVGGTYCAVGQDGAVLRETPSACPEVLKADQVIMDVSKRILTLKNHNGFKSFALGKDLVIWFSNTDFSRTKDFLERVHKP